MKIIMNRNLGIEKLKKLSNYRFEFFSAFIFITYSLIHYSSRGYDHYKDNWGIDQYFIENISRRIVDGESLINHLSHGIGYPILVAPFIHIAANPLNITSFFIFIFFAATIFRNFDIAIKNRKKKVILIFFVLVSLVFSPDMQFWTIGGSNTLTGALILLSVLWSVSPVVPKALPIILGILSGFVFSSRYIDYVLLFPLYFTAVKNYSDIYKKNLFNNLIKSFLISSFFILFSLIVHQAILGDFFATPYDTRVPDPSRLAEADFGEGVSDQFQNRYFSWIIPNLYSTFIDYSSFASKMTVKGAYTALRNCPILILAPYSVINLIIHNLKSPNDYFTKRLRLTLFSVFSSVIIWIIFYASGWAYTAHDLLWHCLRYFMGWTTLLIFVSLFGLTLKPNLKTFFLSTILYILLINYPSYFQKNEFINSNYINKSQVFSNNIKNSKENINLPIPFDNGKKSLLFMQNDGTILGSDNFTNTLFLGECKFKNLNIDNFQEKYNFCNYLNTRTKYLPENGMEFLNVQKSGASYSVFYKLFNNLSSSSIESFIVKSTDTQVESQGEKKLILDTKDRYKIIDKNNKTNFVRRSNKYYEDNANNPYWPHWPLIAAERINKTNQIVTANNKDKVYCIWELDRNWNYKKDRLCGVFGSNDMLKHEKEFNVDIDNDGFINQKFSENAQNKQLKLNIDDKELKIVFKVDPIKMEKNIIRLKLDDNYQSSNNLELNVKLTKTGNGHYKNFPELVSVACDNEPSKCKAYKIGRFNNLWRIWIKTKGDAKVIDIKTIEIPKNKPLYWPIQYVTLRKK